MNTNFGQMYNQRVPWYQDPCPAKQTHFRNSSTASYIGKSYPMAHGRQGRGFQTNKFINGFRSFVSGLFFPAFNSNYCPETYKHYNRPCKSNYKTEGSVNIKHINIEPCLKAAACMSTFLNSRPQKPGLMEMDKETKVIAIFTSEDFPELPPPKKPTWQSKSTEKCSYFEASTKSPKKTDGNIKKDLECDSEDSFVIFENKSPKCSPINNVNNSSVTCIPYREKQRQISECSDDSFVICFTEDAGEGLIEFSDYDSDEVDGNSDHDDEEDTGNFLKKTEHCHIYSGEIRQPDSGFDEQKDKKVRFNLKPTVHVMYTWRFAYQAARKGPWENVALDRLRFQHRIENISEILNPILNSKHRERIYKSRFCNKTLRIE